LFIQKYIKLNLSYLGESKKHHIFRAKKNWDKNFEKITNKPVFTEQFEEIGVIIEIFGPETLPFISMKIISNKAFNPNDHLYAKIR
jgi:rRNA processing protein Gar1